ncbi:hypothetical protein NC651_002309 [Populus alba x Populus x berolinensis]|nr:hypothetical protein NC651_002309 [Populus alba x Populus x berolinensis]
MKSLPGSQPLLGEIPPELVCLPFRSVFSSCPSLFLSLRLVLSFSLFLFLLLLLFRSVVPESLLCSFLYLMYCSLSASSLPSSSLFFLLFSRSLLLCSPRFLSAPTLTLTSPFSFLPYVCLSSGFYSQRMHAFIAERWLRIKGSQP